MSSRTINSVIGSMIFLLNDPLKMRRIEEVASRMTRCIGFGFRQIRFLVAAEIGQHSIPRAAPPNMARIAEFSRRLIHRMSDASEKAAR